MHTIKTICTLLAVVATHGATSEHVVAIEKHIRWTITTDAIPPSGHKRTSRHVETILMAPPGWVVDRTYENHGVVAVKQTPTSDSSLEISDKTKKTKKRKPKPIANGVRIDFKAWNPPLTLSHSVGQVTIDMKVDRPMAAPSLSPKYLEMRKRFLDGFYFGGAVASKITVDGDKRHVTFADQTIDLGTAIAVFATESYIQNAIGHDSTDSDRLVRELLSAFDALDLKAESRFKIGADSIDGLFVRDDVEGIDDKRLQGKGFCGVKSDYQAKGDSFWNPEPSIDQIFGLMTGLVAVKKYSRDAMSVRHAAAISDRVFSWCMRREFLLHIPGKPKKFKDRGPHMWAMLPVYHELNKLVSGKNHSKHISIDIPEDYEIPVSILCGLERNKKKCIENWWKSGTFKLVATYEELRPLLEKERRDGYVDHMILMACAPLKYWDGDQIQHVCLYIDDELPILWQCALHDTIPSILTYEKVIEMLDMCPPEGPNNRAALESGWFRNSRWSQCRKETPNKASDWCDGTLSGKEATEQYTGLDWLLFHNLIQIVFHVEH